VYVLYLSVYELYVYVHVLFVSVYVLYLSVYALYVFVLVLFVSVYVLYLSVGLPEIRFLKIWAYANTCIIRIRMQIRVFIWPEKINKKEEGTLG
jgi:hypothetical protein